MTDFTPFIPGIIAFIIIASVFFLIIKGEKTNRPKKNPKPRQIVRLRDIEEDLYQKEYWKKEMEEEKNRRSSVEAEIIKQKIKGFERKTMEIQKN